MHKELWEQLAELDRKEVAARAHCPYGAETDSYVLRLLNQSYIVNLTYREIYFLDGNCELRAADFLTQLCILSYLIHSKAIPPANRLVNAESLRGGEFFFRGPHKLPVGKLADSFGNNPQRLYQACAPLQGAQRNYGDAAVELPVLPRMPITLVVWRGDEEFEARATILFDQTAAQQLPLDALQALVNLTVNSVVRNLATNYN